ncbi:Trichothecene C-15 hydroxylase [Colletotrichum fructicola]|nr:Trichothecene C-15 hydroxylase [Colletotrichum fructicola]KAF4939030.1 Trichothecene C-15 hydroxylase [Colletotrichum fructicola]
MASSLLWSASRLPVGLESDSVRKMFTLLFCVSVLYTLWRISYNVLLHPLRKFPGPRLWAASRISFAVTCATGQGHRKILQLHEKYGDIVRVAPDELVFCSPDAWKEIYGRRKTARGEISKDYVHYAEAKDSILGAPKDRHTQLRRILSRGFTNSAVLDQEGLIKSHVDQLFNILAEHEQSQGPRTPIDMNKLFDFVALDIITDLGFGDSFHCLHTRKYHPWAQFFLDALPAIALATALKQFQLIFSVLMAMAPKSVLQKHENMVQLTNDIVKRRLDEADRPDLIQAMKEPTSGVGTKRYDQQPLSLQDIQANAQILTMAGYDTTATALAGTTYLLAANADVMSRLIQEVRSSFKDEKEITISSTKSLEYLRAVIDESLRMYPPGASGMPRRIGEEGDVVLGHHIPAGTIVSIWQYAMYHNAKNFSEPEAFIPERWSNDKIDFSDKREAFQPFSFGPRDCIGRHLAYAEVCTIIARLVWRFDLELVDVPGQDWLSRQKNYLLWDRGPLNIRLKQRE